MRILWHAPAPWMPTGYGTQTATFTRLLAAAGHDVTISTFTGLQGRSLEWEGLKVLGGTRESHGNDFLGRRTAQWLYDGGPGFVITLADTFRIRPGPLAGGPVAMWTPVDCDPIGHGDKTVLQQSGAVPIAMSRHGEKMMKAAGLEPLYVPHGIDTGLFQPGDQAAARDALGWPADAFVIGMVGANHGTGPNRKAIPQQLQAFAAFRKTHPDAVLALHTQLDGGEDPVHIPDLAEALGIPPASLLYCDQADYWQGVIGAERMVTFYQALDVLTGASMGEGFGLPLLEAQACGVPVVTSDHSAMREMCGAGWLVAGDPWWENNHMAWWHHPRPDAIRRAYVKAYGLAGRKREQAREFALGYDAKLVTDTCWRPVLADLEGRLAKEVRVT